MNIPRTGRAIALSLALPMASLATAHGGVSPKAAGADPDLAKAAKLVDQGVELIVAQDYKGAIDKFHEALEISPACVDAAHKAGEMLILGGRFDEAKKMLARTLEVVPDDAGCLVQIAQATAHLGETDACVGWLERLAAVGDGATVRSMPVLLLSQGSLKEAAIASDIAVWKNGTDPVGWFNRGLVADAIPNAQVAEASYLKAVELDPGFVDARVNLGNLYERIGEKDKMFAAFEKAYGAKKSALTAYSLGRTLVRERTDVSRGLDLLAEASQGDDEAAAAARAMLQALIARLEEKGDAK